MSHPTESMRAVMQKVATPTTSAVMASSVLMLVISAGSDGVHSSDAFACTCISSLGLLWCCEQNVVWVVETPQDIILDGTPPSHPDAKMDS